jgi:hypothetical protein
LAWPFLNPHRAHPAGLCAVCPALPFHSNSPLDTEALHLTAGKETIKLKILLEKLQFI